MPVNACTWNAGATRVAAIERAAECLLANPDNEIRTIGLELSEHVAAGRRRSLVLTRANAERDALLVDGLARFFAGLPKRAAASEFAAQWRRYEATGWLRDRTCQELPPRHAGSIAEVFWRALKICPHSLSAERLRRLMG